MLEIPAGKYPLSEDMRARLEAEYASNTPRDDQPLRYDVLREAAQHFSLLIAVNTPPGRLQSLALTALEEVSMWANKAISRE